MKIITEHWSHRLGGLVLLAALAVPGAQAQEADEELRALAGEVARLEAEIGLLEDRREIENLQRTYGFYIEENLWTQAADLFAEDGSVEIGGEGVYVGRDSILRYFRTMGEEGPQWGILNDHMQLQPIVHVSQDGTARGRWHHFSQEAVHGESHHWGAGVYENEYVKEDGVWKIKRLHRYTTMRTPYGDGWAVTALPRGEPSEDLPPDQPPSVDYENYPAVFVPPFHYEHPVTGDNSVDVAPQVSVDASGDALDTLMDELDTRLERLQDAEDVENLHAVYGYYLARNQWDELAGIFAEEGTIEIAQRGVYKGRDSVRRNLDLYGEQGELDGQLHNHMQFQPVIHVQDDGTALMRSRAFSMMGAYGGYARWMGGVYENIFVKRDGVWQLLKDQVFNTYFADYDTGWKDLEWRPAPGITEDNPPDEPPSVYFEMYPRPFMPPFHYDNPVTGGSANIPGAEQDEQRQAP